MTDPLARLATLPAVRAAAEAQARAYADAMSAAIVKVGGVPLDYDSPSHQDYVGLCERAALSRLLDPTNPAAEGVIADIYRRVTGQESAHAIPSADGVEWHIAYFGPLTPAFKRLLIWNVCGSHAPTRYEAWVRALVAHYDVLAARKDGTGF